MARPWNAGAPAATGAPSSVTWEHPASLPRSRRFKGGVRHSYGVCGRRLRTRRAGRRRGPPARVPTREFHCARRAPRSAPLRPVPGVYSRARRRDQPGSFRHKIGRRRNHPGRGCVSILWARIPRPGPAARCDARPHISYDAREAPKLAESSPTEKVRQVKLQAASPLSDLRPRCLCEGSADRALGTPPGGRVLAGTGAPEAEPNVPKPTLSPRSLPWA